MWGKALPVAAQLAMHTRRPMQHQQALSLPSRAPTVAQLPCPAPLSHPSGTYFAAYQNFGLSLPNATADVNYTLGIVVEPVEAAEVRWGRQPCTTGAVRCRGQTPGDPPGLGRPGGLCISASAAISVAPSPAPAFSKLQGPQKRITPSPLHPQVLKAYYGSNAVSAIQSLPSLQQFQVCPAVA